MGIELLQKIAESIDQGVVANEQKDQIQEEGKKPEKKEKKKGENPFAKKKEGNGEEKPPEDNGQTGPVPAEKPTEEAPPAGAYAVPANGKDPAEAVPIEGVASGDQMGITQIIDFLQANPQPDVNSVRAFAEQSGMDPEQLEGMIFGLSVKAVNLLRGGAMNESQLDPSTVDPNELEMGIQVEMQKHTPDPSIAKKLALDNLATAPDYYSRLKTMEQNAVTDANAAAVPKQGINNEKPQEEEEKKEDDVNQPVGANNRSEL